MATFTETETERDLELPYRQPAETDEGEFEYRELSKMVIIAAVLLLPSLLSILFFPLLVFPLIALVLSGWGLASIRRRPQELTGQALAIVTIAISSILLFGGTAWFTYVYATEVPDGFERIDFSVLQPNDNEPKDRPPPAALALDGKKVFIKAYIHPDLPSKNGIREFVLIPDLKTCCFGGQPALTDMVEVRLREGLSTNYSLTKRKLAGTLRVSSHLNPRSKLSGVFYILDAEYVK